MRKAILMILLVVLSKIAMAEWVKVGGDAVMTIYNDPATIRKNSNNGNWVKMWYLFDFKTVQVDSGNKFMSLKSQSEFDCKEDQVRLLSFSAHSNTMGRGNVVDSKSDHFRWDPVPPGSVNEVLWKIACGKR